MSEEPERCRVFNPRGQPVEIHWDEGSAVVGPYATVELAGAAAGAPQIRALAERHLLRVETVAEPAAPEAEAGTPARPRGRKAARGKRARKKGAPKKKKAARKKAAKKKRVKKTAARKTTRKKAAPKKAAPKKGARKRAAKKAARSGAGASRATGRTAGSRTNRK